EKLITQSRASQAEIVAGEGFHDQGHDIFTEFLSSRTEHQLQRVRARGDVESILVVEGTFGEFFKFFLFIIQLHFVAEPCGNGAVLAIGDSQYVYVRMEAPLLLLEVD